jgi:ABC-2 type transport system permease protein
MRALRHDYPLLLRIQLLELRTWGPLVAVLTTLLPIAMILGFGAIGGGVERGGYLYIVSGSAVISLVTIGLVATAQDVGEMQRDGVFQYYASLPISKAALLGALTTVRVLTALPGIVVTLAVGALRYDTPTSLNVATLALLPLTVLALSGIGAAIGILVRDLRAVAALSQLALIAVMFASPVLIPRENLPAVLQGLAYALPPTYAADGLRHALAADLDARLLADLGVLALCTALSLTLVARGLRWRAD